MDSWGASVDGDGYWPLFEAASEGMLLLDGSRSILGANPAACRLLRRSRKDMVGMRMEDLADRSYPVLDAAWERFREDGAFDVSARLLRGDGTRFPAAVSVRGKAGEEEGATVGVVFRETGPPEEMPRSLGADEKQASAAEYGAMVEGALDAMAVSNLDNTLRYVNPAFARLMGYGQEEMVGMFVPDVIHPEDLAKAAEINAEIENNLGFYGPFECRYRRKDGTWIVLETTLNNLADDPEVRAVVAVCRDATERRRSEERLRESEERFRAMVENAQDFIVLADKNNVATYASPAIERILGYAPEEFVGTVVAGYGHPDEAEAALQRIAETIVLPGPQNLGVWRYRHKDGSWRWLETVANNRLDDPVLRGVVCNCRDVTERVEAEERLRESEVRHRALVENAYDFVALADENNVALYGSPSIERILGWSPDEFVGSVIASYVHPDDLEDCLDAVANSLTVAGPQDLGMWRYRCKDGSYRWLEVVVNNRLGDPALRGVVCNCRDVTDRIEAERKLRESEERHRALNENALDLVLIQAPDSTLSYASPSMKRLLGYDPREEIGKKPEDFIHPDDLEWAWPVFYKMLQTPGINEGVTIRYKHKDGRWRWFESVCNNQLENPAVQGLVFNCRDVTEKVEAQERLSESEEWHRALNEHAADLIVVQKADATVSYVSPSVERVLGYSPEEFVAVGVPAIIHPEDLQGAWDALGEVVENPGLIRSRTLHYKHADGTWRILETVCNSRIDDPAVHGLVFNCRDVTERVRAEEKLREAEERYRLLVEQVPAVTYIERNDTESSTVYVSPQVRKMLGYEPEEWRVDSGLWLRTMHPEDHGRVFARHLRCNETGEPFDEEYRCFAKDGREMWVRDEARLVRDEDGQPLYWQGVKVDITARKRAELEILRLNTDLRGQVAGYTAELKAAIEGLKESERYLREREEQFHATFERAAVGIAHVSPRGRWLRVNEKLCEILGYSREELLAKTFQDLTHPEDVDADVRQAERLLRGEVDEYSMEKRYLKRDGAVIWASLSVSMVRRGDEASGHFISVIEDITRRKRAEAVLKVLSPREVEVLREMVGGKSNVEIATRFGSSLNTIKAHVKNIMEKLEVTDRTSAAVYAAEVGLFSQEFRVPDAPLRAS